MRLLVTRPKEDAASLVEILKKEGHEPVLFPLLTIVAEDDGKKALQALNEKDIQALLVTSANGVRAFVEADKRRGFKVLAVGAASADAARDAGFKDVASADGDVDALAKLVKEKCDPKKGKLLHIAGSSVAGDLKGLVEKEGFAFDRVVLYRADQTTALSDSLIAQFKDKRIDGVLLYSPRTAASFAELAEKAGLKNHLKTVLAYGLSEAVASKIKHLEFKEVKVAATPDQDALLALIAKPGDGDMTAKKDENKKDDVKVIDAKAEEVKIKDAPKPAPKADAPKTADTKAKDGAAKPVDPVEEALKAKKDDKAASTTAPKKGSFKAKVLVAGVVILAAGGAGAYFTQNMWVPKVKAEIAKALNIETAQSQDTRLAEEALLRLEARLKELESRPVTEAAPNVDVQPLLDRIALLEGTLAEVKTGLSTVQIANGSEDKLEEFKQLAARLEAVEGSKGPDVSGLEAENQRLSQLLQELNARLTDVEAARLQARSAGENAQALVAALSALRQVMQTSQGFAAELQTLSVLASGDVVLEQAVEGLNGFANGGLASHSALRTAFEKTANDIVRAAALPEGSGWMEQTVKNVTSLVSIRRAPGNLDGEGVLGTVARAEQNVRDGDLAAAVKELSTLEGKPLETAKSWIDAAQARLDGDSALGLMQAHILSLLTSAGGQG